MRFHSYLSLKNERCSHWNSESRNRSSKLPRKFQLLLQISKICGHAWHRLTVKVIWNTVDGVPVHNIDLVPGTGTSLN